MMRSLFLGMMIWLAALAFPASGTAAELVMFEEAGCPWCAAWNRDIAAIYPKTAEGKRAPLRRVDLHAVWPDDLPELEPVHYTPTFVLIDNGQEIGRILGYPGEDFFWGLLGELIERLEPIAAPQAAGGSGQ